jgi:hypothetical protein
VRDVRLGRARRDFLDAILEEKLERIRQNIRLAEEHQHMAEFRIWCEAERQAKSIRKALELAS